MKKRILSVVLIVAVFACLFSVGVSADQYTRVTEVNFECPGYAPGCPLPVPTIIGEGVKYKTQDVSYAFIKDGKMFCFCMGGLWCLTDEVGTPIDTPKPEMPDCSGCDYMLAVMSFETIGDTYAFDKSTSVYCNYEPLSAEDEYELIKGGKNGWYFDSSDEFIDDDDALFAVMSYELPKLPTVDTVTVTVPDDLAGKNAKEILSKIKAHSNVTVEHIEFRDANGDTLKGALPKDAKEANLYIILKAKDGYRFKSLPNEYGFAKWTGADVKVNGTAATKVSLGDEISDKPSVGNLAYINPDKVVYMSVKATVKLNSVSETPETSKNTKNIKNTKNAKTAKSSKSTKSTKVSDADIPETSPKMGDNPSVLPWALMSILSLAGICFTTKKVFVK